MNIKRIVGIAVVIILFISGVASVALYKVGDRVFDEMIEQAMLPDDTPTTPSELGTKNTADQQKQEPSPIPTAPAVMPTIEKPTAEPTKQPAKSASEAVKTDNSLQIPKQKIEEIKEDVTASDKMTMAALVFKKLKQQDIEQLLKMATGGITSDEREKMKKLALERFTAEEIKQIKAMYYKYMN